METRCLVIIPAYNEQETIQEVVSLSLMHADVCVVDDASTDDTPGILARIAPASAPGQLHVIRHLKNTHIARSILDGMRFGIEQAYDFCITMDCGMSHDPRALPHFMDHVDADLVIGFRTRSLAVPLYRKALSRTGNFLFNRALVGHWISLKGAGLQDVTSGYRMYSQRACQLLVEGGLQSRTFDFHLEALAYVYRARLTIQEVPITYRFTNSSLRWKIVADALQTCLRIWTARDIPNLQIQSLNEANV